MSNPYTLREAFNEVGRELFEADWTGHEVWARQPPVMMTVRRRKGVADHPAIDALIDHDYPNLNDDEWRVTRDRCRPALLQLRDFIRHGQVAYWIIYPNGARDNPDPPQWEADDGRLRLHYPSSRGGFASCSPTDVIEYGDVFIDRVQLDACLAELGQELTPVPADAPNAGGLKEDARSKGGSRSRRNPWLQEALGRIVVVLKENGTPATFPAVWAWLKENTSSNEPHAFDPPILGCDYLYVDGDGLSFRDQEGTPTTLKRRSLERYMPKPSTHQS